MPDGVLKDLQIAFKDGPMITSPDSDKIVTAFKKKGGDWVLLVEIPLAPEKQAGGIVDDSDLIIDAKTNIQVEPARSSVTFTVDSTQNNLSFVTIKVPIKAYKKKNQQIIATRDQSVLK